MKRALPTQDELLAILRYEPETGKLFWRERTLSDFVDGAHSAEHTCRWWNTRFAGKEALASAISNGYLMGRIHGEALLAHRVIWKLVTGEEPDEIDHINGSKEDNRFANLRDVNRHENRRNMPLPSNNRSGVMGVWWSARDGKWYARIRTNGHTIHLGCFDDFNDAVAARKAAEHDHDFHQNHGRAAVGRKR